jgi:hypothetical protein
VADAPRVLPDDAQERDDGELRPLARAVTEVGRPERMRMRELQSKHPIASSACAAAMQRSAAG